jgi:hypothetical protein
MLIFSFPKQAYSLPRLCTLVVAALLSYPTVHAAPVTFRFEAEVASINEIGLTLPFDLAIGDIITVNYSFQPATGTSSVQSYPQEMPLSVKFDEKTLATSEYLISIGDNRPVELPSAGSLADPTAAMSTLSDEGPPGYVDDYSISCGSPLPGSCGEFPGHANLSWHFIANFAYDSTLFGASDLPSIPTFLNEATFREMRLTIFQPDSADGIGLGLVNSAQIGAYIREVQAIPEPSCCFGIVCAVLSVAFRMSSSGNRRSF